MNLPNRNDDYSKREYWNDRFLQEKSYDWLVNYEDIKSLVLLHSHEAKSSRVLILGCGCSTLSYDMYVDGYENIVSTDFSPVAIASMKAKYQDSRVIWECMDMTDLKYDDESFDVIIDKAALDALTSAEKDVW
eukprot:CAMPEP_0171464390 /NCGR_PEP_ID=MMETSP0945-20130129/7728_1 /TAXON_ID=109269 /ORGANISM="Vaucheria litorea, Strain CCMP2940" /LENGTH=132 /DNA_ID=CAMNT_0011991469 /DNA_START=360 /DNA_END=755 /DNA_ORIENTATION=+